jgi:hypothetical protein
MEAQTTSEKLFFFRILGQVISPKTISHKNVTSSANFLDEKWRRLYHKTTQHGGTINDTLIINCYT